jgi:hypothetical protein
LTGAESVTFVVLVGLVAGLLWLIPTMSDLLATNRRREAEPDVVKALAHAREETDAHGTSRMKESNRLIAVVRQMQKGMEGLTRGVLALIVVTLLAVALAAVLVSDAADSGDLRKTIVTSLTTVFATIAGFYFGSRTAEKAAEDHPAAAAPAPGGGNDPQPQEEPLQL